ncbi:lipocalin family protein [Pedobacter africanus]|uniref:Lipocalin-like domain-containing protein n=1 Tax=Pedobacter africanus TaxID=151894 RepID=A0A1W2DEU4_9SPHI|nr:lipocalin family protein [Pedobacter africanus]SMC95488.1 Lipocalin-like domain-containing protein [Pedobacter africanus]
MKRIFLIAAILCSSLMVLQSCSPKGAATTQQPLKRGNVTGNWILNDITFEGIPQTSVKSLFGESSYKCFVGSTWRLTNSGNGSYSLPGGADCAAKTQTIYWSASTKEDTFQFKKLYEGDKAKNVTEGYRMLLSSTDGQTMVIKTPVEYGTTTAYIVLNFNKAAK